MTYIIDESSKNSNCYKQITVIVILTIITALIGFLHLNEKLFLIINAYHVYVPNKILNTINLIAAPKKFILPALLILLTLIFNLKYIKRVVFLLINFYILFFVLKIVVHEARPFTVLAQNTMFLLANNQDKLNNLNVSFPSGHTGITTLFVFTLMVIFKIRNNFIKTLLILLPIIVGLTRLLTGWHWPIDVLASGIIAYILVWVFFCKTIKPNF